MRINDIPGKAGNSMIPNCGISVDNPQSENEPQPSKLRVEGSSPSAPTTFQSLPGISTATEPQPFCGFGSLNCGITAESPGAALCRSYFTRLIDPLRAIARSHGYALAVHGSLARDINLVAVPWVENVSEPRSLAEAIRAEAERIIGYAFLHPAERGEYFQNGCPGGKPHGRLTWSFHLGGGPYIDLSVMTGVRNG